MTTAHPLTRKNIAVIFQGTTGKYYIGREKAGRTYCHPRWPGFETKSTALHMAYQEGFTHATGSGSYAPQAVRAIRNLVVLEPWEHGQHLAAQDAASCNE